MYISYRSYLEQVRTTVCYDKRFTAYLVQSDRGIRGLEPFRRNFDVSHQVHILRNPRSFRYGLAQYPSLQMTSELLVACMSSSQEHEDLVHGCLRVEVK